MFTKNLHLECILQLLIVNQNLLMFVSILLLGWYLWINCYVRIHYTTPSPARKIVKFWISCNCVILAMKIQNVSFSSSCFKQRISVMSWEQLKLQPRKFGVCQACHGIRLWIIMNLMRRTLKILVTWGEMMYDIYLYICMSWQVWGQFYIGTVLYMNQNRKCLIYKKLWV
jgi:hypothetical protein